MQDFLHDTEQRECTLAVTEAVSRWLGTVG